MSDFAVSNDLVEKLEESLKKSGIYFQLKKLAQVKMGLNVHRTVFNCLVFIIDYIGINFVSG